jgi:hypothetical protein
MFGSELDSARRYFVISRSDEWEVVVDCHYLDRFSSRDDAIRQAIDWAQIAGASGFTAEVFIQAQGDDFKVTWTYGHDAYPPTG